MRYRPAMQLTPAQIEVVRMNSRDELGFNSLIDLFAEVMVTASYQKPSINAPSEGLEKSKVRDKKLTICIVDDQVPITDSLRRILGGEGHRVITSSNPLSAIRLMENDIPDLAFLDYQMPEMDGGDLLAEMRLHPLLKMVPVVFITGLISPGEESKLNFDGPQAFLAKPHSKAQLLEVIAKVQTSIQLKTQVTLDY